MTGGRAEGRSSAGHRWIVLGVILAGAVLLLLRRGEALRTPFLWAEDGAVFVQQGLEPGSDLLTPYNGQLWLLQRLLVLGGRVLPLEALPLTLLLGSLLLTLLGLAVLLQARLTPLFGGLRYQALAFGLLLLLPGAWDTLGTTLSVHWWLVFSAAAVLIAPPARHRGGLVAELGWLALLGLSGLAAWIVLPIAIGAMVVRRDRAALLRGIVILATAAVQAVILLTSTREASADTGLIDLARITVLRIGGVAVIGESTLASMVVPGTSIPALALGAAFLIVAALVALLGRRWPSVALLLAAVVSTALGLWGAAEPLALLTLPGGGRYFVPAIGMAVLILVLGLTAARRGIRIVSAIALASMAFAIVTDARIASPEPDLSPSAWSSFASCVEASDGACEVAIAPEGWRVTTP